MVLEKYRIHLSLLGMALAIVVIQACQKEEVNTEQPFQTTAYELRVGPLPQPILPTDNALTDEGVNLGRRLFYDKKLSADNTQSCASCHRQEHAFTDTAKLSLGIRGLQGKRQAMAIFNMAWHNNAFFWDGRAELLRHQALMPIQDPLEMDQSLEDAIAKLKVDPNYPNLFKRAFGSEEIASERLSLALEQFMNSIVSIDSKYDSYLAGQASLTDSEERGRALFFGEYNPFFPNESGADCAHCHSTATFENDRYMNNGLDLEAEMQDIGRMAVTQDPADKAKFKVTSLRNIELTPPYMHDGRFQTLEQVVEHYNSGIQDAPSLDPTLRNTIGTGLMLDAQEKADLVAFLKTLTDTKLTTNPAYSDPN